MSKNSMYCLAVFAASLVVVVAANYALAKMGEPSAMWFMQMIGVM